MDKIKKNIAENWVVITIFIVTVVFNVGVSYAMLTSKPDRDEVSTTIDIKIKDHRENDKEIYFKGIDGIELKTKLESLEKRQDEIYKIIVQWK